MNEMIIFAINNEQFILKITIIFKGNMEEYKYLSIEKRISNLDYDLTKDKKNLKLNYAKYLIMQLNDYFSSIVNKEVQQKATASFFINYENLQIFAS